MWARGVHPPSSKSWTSYWVNCYSCLWIGILNYSTPWPWFSDIGFLGRRGTGREIGKKSHGGGLEHIGRCRLAKANSPIKSQVMYRLVHQLPLAAMNCDFELLHSRAMVLPGKRTCREGGQERRGCGLGHRKDFWGRGGWSALQAANLGQASGVHVCGL